MAHPPTATVGSVDPRPRWSYAVAALVFVALVYLPSLANGFTYDDPTVIADASRLLSDPSLLGRLFTIDYFRLSGESTYRPMVTLTYLVDWQVGGGAPWAFHLHSLAWHLVATAGLLTLIGRLGARPGTAAIAAALYGVHPALTEAVDAVAFREDVLVTALVVLATLALTGHRPRVVRIALGSSAVAAAVLSKESGVVVLALVPLTEWALAAGQSRRWTFRARAPEYIATAAVVAGYLVLRFVVFPSSDLYGNRVGGSIAASLATGIVVTAYYLRLLVYPVLLCADYRGVVLPVSAAGDWRLWLSFAALSAATAVAWRWRRVRPAVWWGWGWYLVAVAPVSNVVPMPTFMAERFLHLPFAGLIAGLVLALAGVTWRQAVRPRTLAVTSLVVIGALGVVTARRHAVWQSNETLWQATLSDHPTAQGALHGYGSVLVEQGRYYDALTYFRQLLADPTIGRDRRAVVSMELGSVYDRLGQVELARQAFEDAVAAAPDPRARLGLSLVDVKLGRYDEADRQLQALVAEDPQNAEAHDVRGGVLSILGRRADAVASWREAIRLNPDLASAHANLGVALGATGDLTGGIAALERALAIQPRQAPWHVALARLLARHGTPWEAVEHLETALALDPGSADAREALEALRPR